MLVFLDGSLIFHKTRLFVFTFLVPFFFVKNGNISRPDSIEVTWIL